MRCATLTGIAVLGTGLPLAAVVVLVEAIAPFELLDEPPHAVKPKHTTNRGSRTAAADLW